MRRLLCVIAVFSLVAAACGGATTPGGTQATTAPAAAADDKFFEGKTIRVIVGFEAGGGFDSTARFLARHMGKHIPGNPTLVVENMPAAGSRAAANYLYKVAQPDGLTIGVFNELQVLQQALGFPDIEFDAKKFSWLGSVFSATIVCLARKDKGFSTLADIQGSKQFIVGSTGPGANTNDFPAVLRVAIGANIKLVTGYQGTAGITRAFDSGEVDGGCWTWESMSVTQGQNIKDGKAVPLIQQGDEKIKELPNVPMAVDVAKTDAGKAMIKAITAPAVISKSFTAPPGVPAARLKILRDAWLKTWNDPALREEAKGKLDLLPKDYTAVQKVVDELFGFDKALMDQLNAALKAK